MVHLRSVRGDASRATEGRSQKGRGALNATPAVSAQPALDARPRSRSRTAVRLFFLALALGLLGWTVARRGDEVLDRVGELSVAALVVTEIAVLASLVCSLASWRVLLAGLGSPLPFRLAGRIFFLGQLGKYLPGGGWAVLGHMELARDVGIPRTRAAAATLLALAIAALTAMVLGGAVLALSPRAELSSPWWLLLLPPALLLLLEPRIMLAVLGWVLRVARRTPLEHAPDRRVALSATAWALAAWALLGAHVWVLARDLGGEGAGLSLLVLGTYAVAWLAGTLAPLVPAGLGAREAVLTLGLTSTLSGGSATLLALTSRLLLTLGDVLTVALFTPLGRGGRAPRRDG